MYINTQLYADTTHLDICLQEESVPTDRVRYYQLYKEAFHDRLQKRVARAQRLGIAGNL